MPDPALDLPESPAPRTRRGGGRRRWWPRARARFRQFRRRVLLLGGPIGLTALFVWGAWVLFSPRIANELLVITLLSFFGLGTTVILAPAAMGGGLEIPLIGKTMNLELGTWQIAVWLMYLNTAAAFLYAYNLDLLEKVPVIGPYLQRARRNAVVSLEQHPWIRRLAGFGVGFFVLTPLPGSGQLGGCFVGRVIGLSKRATFLVVTIAGILVASAYALFGAYIKGVLDEAEADPRIRVLGALVLIGFVFFLIKLLRFLGREEGAAPVAKKRRPVLSAVLTVGALSLLLYAFFRVEVHAFLARPEVASVVRTVALSLAGALLLLLVVLVRRRRARAAMRSRA